MTRFWSSLLGRREPDPQTVEKLKQSSETLEAAQNRSEEVFELTNYLAARREQNHFGDALDITFRRRYA